MDMTIAAGTLPGPVTPISPSGNVGTRTPTFTWNAVSGATGYEIYVADPTGAVQKLRQTLSAAQAGCAAGTGTCTFTPASALDLGAASWWVRAQNGSGNGPWSSGVGITIAAGVLASASGSMSPAIEIHAANQANATATSSLSSGALPAALLTAATGDTLHRCGRRTQVA